MGVYEAREDERIGDGKDCPPWRVGAVGGDAGDRVAFDDHLALQHGAIRRDNRPAQDLFGRVGPLDDGRGRCQRRGQTQDGRREGDADGAHGLNAFGTVTVIVTRFALSSFPVRRAQSALPHIQAGLPAGRSSWGMSGSSAGVKAAL